jgi:hypothetical protein
VNIVLCVLAALVLGAVFGIRPPWSPFWYPFRTETELAELTYWNGGAVAGVLPPAAWIARVFWLNWVLFLFNLILPGFPLDGGRLLQCALWPRYGFRQATTVAVFAGFITAFGVGIAAVASNNVLLLCLALFIYATCRQQYILLETGAEDSLFGYDFSQGYTSLEEEAVVARRRQPSFWQRWLQRRALRKRLGEQQTREAEEKRMDELLAKVQREGLAALSDEERRFLKRVSDRYRHR